LEADILIRGCTILPMDGRVRVRFGPHAVYTCSPNLLMKVRDMASELNVGIHIHLAESKDMVELVKEKYGSTEVELVESLGFLKPDVLAAHCIYLSEKEMQIMAKRDVKVSYNPVANMKVAALLQKVYYMDSTVLPAQSVVKMATIDGARALGLEGSVGSLEVGKKADVILLDFRKPHLTPVHDFYANMIYSARGSDVETVIVDGKILMEGREVKTLGEEDIMERAKETALDLLAR